MGSVEIKMKAAALCCILFFLGVSYAEDLFLEELRSKIPNGQWTAERQFESSADAKRLLGTLKDPRTTRTYRKDLVEALKGYEAPDTFDARENWPECTTIPMVWDQAACGSCWAVAAAGAMSDRMCIHNKVQVLVSAENLMTCCRRCGFGCDGGYPHQAWEYWKSTGIVNGGFYGSTDTCQPYSVQPCDHHVEGKLEPCGDTVDTPSCSNECISTYNGDYASANTLGESAYDVPRLQMAIMEEIQNKGPVEASIDVYEDFLHYKSGVYEHVKGEMLGGHAVRMIGWGEEAGTPYWLIVNSWNADWGDKGLIKIKRGSNECGIESGLTAGLPKSI